MSFNFRRFTPELYIVHLKFFCFESLLQLLFHFHPIQLTILVFHLRLFLMCHKSRWHFLAFQILIEGRGISLEVGNMNKYFATPV